MVAIHRLLHKQFAPINAGRPPEVAWRDATDPARERYSAGCAHRAGGTGAALARLAYMPIFFTQPARAAPDPPGLILSAADAARQAATRPARHRWPRG